MSKKERYFLKSLANGINALVTIAESEHALSLSEIAKALKTSNATATRICYTLTELQLLQRNEHYRYTLTPNTLKFGYAAICALGWRGVAKFYLKDLFTEIREIVGLSILVGPDVLYLFQVGYCTWNKFKFFK